jgi:hypothetical protein
MNQGEKGEKRKYEPPSVYELQVDLTQAMGQTVCTTGRQAAGACQRGQTPAGVTCVTGQSASTQCGAGGGPGTTCSAGGTPAM